MKISKASPRYPVSTPCFPPAARFPLKMELYDNKGKLIKIMFMENIKNIQGHWTPLKTSMKNTQTNHKTIIEMTKIIYDEKIPAGIFTTRFLQAGRL